jgi:hypothetical protein
MMNPTFDPVNPPVNSRKSFHDAKQPPSFIQRLFLLTKNAGSSTTLHGIPNIIESPFAFIKFIWLVAFLASLAGLGYFLYLAIADFLEWKVVTTIKVVSEVPTTFPTVIISIIILVAPALFLPQ